MARRRKNYFHYVDQDSLSRISGEPLLTPFPMEGSVSGHHRSPHKGSSVEFAEYREYTPGEDPKRMDWRVFARSDRYYLKEFEAETNLRSHFALDCSGSMGFGDPKSKLEFGKSLVSTLSYLYVGQGDAVGLHTLRRRKPQVLPAKRNPSQIQEFLEVLGPVKPKGDTFLAPALHEIAETVRMRAMIFVVSDMLDEPSEILDAVLHLRDRKHEVVLFHLFDRQELEFDFDRPTRFVDLEGGGSLITEPTVIREEYLARLDEHVQELRKGCLESQARYHVVRTDKPLVDAIDQFSAGRIGGKAA
ncbi:MAG TPA: DUF58 domain-containing protein [Opitutae bacterium]|nr:DUF58 domain-containing protein [Opitutae bacterium]